MAAQDLTSPVAAIQLAAGAFFSAKMTTWDLTSPVAANQLAAGAFFPVKMATQDLTSPVAANQLAAGALFFRQNGHPGFDELRHQTITGGATSKPP